MSILPARESLSCHWSALQSGGSGCSSPIGWYFARHAWKLNSCTHVWLLSGSAKTSLPMRGVHILGAFTPHILNENRG